jgi:hypothetical protein
MSAMAESCDFEGGARGWGMVTMMAGEPESCRQLWERIREAVKRFGSSCFQHCLDEFWRENPRIFQMDTAPAHLQPELQVLVQQMNESSADQPGGRRAQQTTPEVTAEIIEEVHRMSTPERDGHCVDEMWRILAVIDTLHQIPKMTESLSRESSRGVFP